MDLRLLLQKIGPLAVMCPLTSSNGLLTTHVPTGHSREAQYMYTAVSLGCVCGVLKGDKTWTLNVYSVTNMVIINQYCFISMVCSLLQQDILQIDLQHSPERITDHNLQMQSASPSEAIADRPTGGVPSIHVLTVPAECS